MFGKLENRNNFARAWLDGYIVEKGEKIRNYTSKPKRRGLISCHQNANLGDKYGHFSPVVLLFTKSTNFSRKMLQLMKKDVVANGFGWVFDCPGVKVQEVE